MTKFFFSQKMSLLFLIICLSFITHSALYANTAQSSTSTNTSSEITINSWDDWKALPADQKQQVLIVLGFFFLMMIVKTTHQLMVLVRRPMSSLNLQSILEKRVQNSLPDNAAPEDNQLALDLIAKGTKGWKEYENADGETVLLPAKKSHISRMKRNLKRIKEILPTDNKVIETVNYYISLVNSEQKRTFVGSRIILGIFILAVPINFLQPELALMEQIIILLATAVFGFHYFCDYRVPKYKLRRRNEKYQFHNVSSKALLYLLNQVAMAKVYKVTTLWSDGTETISYDYTDVLFQFVILLIGLVFIIMLFPFMMVINYLRNYIF